MGHRGVQLVLVSSAKTSSSRVIWSVVNGIVRLVGHRAVAPGRLQAEARTVADQLSEGHRLLGRSTDRCMPVFTFR